KSKKPRRLAKDWHFRRPDMALKALKWPKNTNSTRIFRTEAGSFQKNWLNEENRSNAIQPEFLRQRLGRFKNFY
ncbi:MAG: hypothetical protein IIT67_05315, partial [Clostridia bacterium]|nr:hypothetical protein [Clostridia bacterium]